MAAARADGRARACSPPPSWSRCWPSAASTCRPPRSIGWSPAPRNGCRLTVLAALCDILDITPNDLIHVAAENAGPHAPPPQQTHQTRPRAGRPPAQDPLRRSVRPAAGSVPSSEPAPARGQPDRQPRHPRRDTARPARRRHRTYPPRADRSAHPPGRDARTRSRELLDPQQPPRRGHPAWTGPRRRRAHPRSPACPAELADHRASAGPADGHRRVARDRPPDPDVRAVGPRPTRRRPRPRPRPAAAPVPALATTPCPARHRPPTAALGRPPQRRRRSMEQRPPVPALARRSRPTPHRDHPGRPGSVPPRAPAPPVLRRFLTWAIRTRRHCHA